MIDRARALEEVDALLRGRGAHRAGVATSSWVLLTACVVGGGALYGAAMGGYNGRPLQSGYSALKVPILLGVSALICLPSFCVINVLLGLGDQLGAACRAVLGTQAVVALALASLAPLVPVCYLSVQSYQQALLANGALFALASLGGQLALARHYRALIAIDPRHRLARDLWLALFVFVSVQMAWVLRPYIGTPNAPPTFLREGAWGNAYVVVFRLIANQL